MSRTVNFYWTLELDHKILHRSGSIYHKQWADVDQSDCVWKGKCIYWGCTKRRSVVLLTLNVWKMLYCTFAKVRSAASLSSDVYCSLWYLCTGKVKYISRVEFGFYANRCFFLWLKAINIKKMISEFVSTHFWFIVRIFHKVVCEPPVTFPKL